MKKLSLLILFFGVIACTEKTPMPLSDDDPQGEVIEVTLSSSSVATTDGPQVSSMSGSPYLYLGEFDNKKCSILLKYNNIPTDAQIISAKIRLTTTDSLEILPNTFEATAHKVTQPWEISEVTFENFANAWGDQIGSGTVTTSAEDSIVIDLDVEYVQSWMDTTLDNNGVYIRTDAENIGRRFNAITTASFGPTLEVIYLPTDSTSNDTTTLSPTSDTFIFEDNSTVEDGPLYVGNGAEFRTILKYDLSNIPEHATINSANLILTIDKEHSFVDSTGLVINAFALAENDTAPFTAQLDSTEFIASSVRTTIALSTVSLNIRSRVQLWNREDVTNYENFGMLILPTDRDDAIQRVAFFNTGSPDGKGPKLNIHYTLPPSQ